MPNREHGTVSDTKKVLSRKHTRKSNFKILIWETQ